jgi:hypothetical protein
MEGHPVDAPCQLPVNVGIRFLPWGAEARRVMSQLVDQVGRVVGIGREHVDDVDFDVEPADTQELSNSGEPSLSIRLQYSDFITLWPWRKIW